MQNQGFKVVSRFFKQSDNFKAFKLSQTKLKPNQTDLQSEDLKVIRLLRYYRHTISWYKTWCT